MKTILFILILFTSACTVTQDAAKRKIVLTSIVVNLDGSATFKGLAYIDAQTVEQAQTAIDSAKKVISFSTPVPVKDSVNLYSTDFILNTPKFIKP